MARLFQNPRGSEALERWWNKNFRAYVFLFMSALVAVGAAQTIIFALLNLAFAIICLIPGFRMLAHGLLYAILLPNKLFEFGISLALIILSASSGPILLAVINTIVFHPNLFSNRAKLVSVTACICLYLHFAMRAMGLTWMSWNGEISLKDGWLGWVELAALVYWAVRGNEWDQGCITAVLNEYQSLAGGFDKDIPFDVKFPMYIHYLGQYRQTEKVWIRRKTDNLRNSTASTSMRSSTSSLATIQEENVSLI